MDIPVLATDPYCANHFESSFAVFFLTSIPFLQMRDKLFARQACVIHSE